MRASWVDTRPVKQNTTNVTRMVSQSNILSSLKFLIFNQSGKSVKGLCESTNILRIPNPKIINTMLTRNKSSPFKICKPGLCSSIPSNPYWNKAANPLIESATPPTRKKREPSKVKKTPSIKTNRTIASF